jgi:transposase
MRLGDVESDARHGSLRRYEQRLERREKKQQVIALGRLGWPLWRIEQETGVRRGTAGAYLKAAGIGVRPPEEWGRRAPAKAANAMAIGQDLVSESGFRGGYKTVKRFVRKLRGHQPLQAHAVIIIEPEKIKISAASW